MKPKKIHELGMPLDEWTYKSCVANCGVGDDWATVYYIKSKEKGRGHATKLLLIMKEYYEKQGLTFSGSIAINDRMHKLYQKCGIKEFNEESQATKVNQTSRAMYQNK